MIIWNVAYCKNVKIVITKHISILYSTVYPRLEADTTVIYYLTHLKIFQRLRNFYNSI